MHVLSERAKKYLKEVEPAGPRPSLQVFMKFLRQRPGLGVQTLEGSCARATQKDGLGSAGWRFTVQRMTCR